MTKTSKRVKSKKDKNRGRVERITLSKPITFNDYLITKAVIEIPRMVAMSMSNREVISLVKNSKKNVKKITHRSDKKTLSFEDKMKISICKHFVQYMNEERITLTALSKQLKLPKSRVSEIVNYKISKYKVDKLITNLLKLAEFSPKTKAYIELVGEALEFPAGKVSETKKLTKTIKNIHLKTIEAYA